MTRQILFSAILLLFFSGNIFAQGTSKTTQSITGTVTDAQSGESLTGVILVLKSSHGKTLGYSTSDMNGEFTLKSPSLSKSDTLSASLLGYSTVSLSPEPGKKMSIKMEPAAMNIREVTVYAPKIQMHGDTIKYNISSFAEVQDKNLGDVLKKLPGIDVDKGGQIKYNGTAINKLYIEGVDMLGGKYGLATNNIAPKDVKSVEVLENHQPTKALQGITYSEQAALNISLQEDAKAKWIGTADLGAGAGGKGGDGALWDAKLFAMRIGAKWQSLNTFKTNNTGDDINSEINTFSYTNLFLDNNSYSLPDFFSIGVSNAPLAKNRVRFNRSYLFNTTNSFKLSTDYQLNIQASYFNERLTSSNTSQTQYFLEDSTITISEGVDAKTYTHSISANAELRANTEKYYLNNKLSASGEWNDAQVSILGQAPNTQDGNMKSFEIINDFKYTRRISRHALSIASYNQYSSKPQNLNIARENGNSQQQSIVQAAFYSNTSASYGLNFKKGWSLSMKGGFKALVRNLESELTGVAETSYSLENNLQMAYANAHIQPSLVYKSLKFTASLNIPASYTHYKYCSVGAENILNDELIFKPRLYFKYSITPKFLVSATGSIGGNGVNEQNFYEGLILSNYRYIKKGIVNFDNSNAKSVSGGFEYKDPIENLFFNGTVLRSWNTTPNLSAQTFIGNYIISSFIPFANSSRTWHASIGGSKGFYGINGLLGLDASFSTTSANMLQSVEESSSLTPYNSSAFTLRPKFNGRMASWMLLEYNLTYTHSILKMTESGTTSKNNEFNHTLSLTFTPIKPLNIKVTAEHYFTQISEIQNKNTILADIVTRYNLNEKIEFALTATNILNQKTYSYTSFNGPSSFTAAYQIRPINILFGIYMKL